MPRKTQNHKCEAFIFFFFQYYLFLCTFFPIPLAYVVLIVTVVQVMSVVLLDKNLHSFPYIYSSM